MNRRTYLGTVATGALAALAGCTVGGLENVGSDPTATPVVDGTVPSNGDIPQFQADAANTGVHAETGPTDAVETVWRRTPSRYENSQPAVVGDTVYVDFDGNLVALERGSGEPRWTTDVGHAGGTAPAVHDGTVYATVWNGGESVDRGLAAVDADSGDVRWRGATDQDVGAAPTATDDGVFVGGGYENATVAAFDHDGTERWRRELGEYASTPAVAGLSAGDGDSSDGSSGGTVYYGAGSAAVVALDSATGEQQWRRSTDGETTAAPVLAGDTLLAGSRAGTLYALDAADGTERWTVDVGGPVRRSPAVTDDRVLVPTDEGLVALDREGSEQWRADELGRVTAPVVAGETVYVGDHRVLRALATDDGTERWTFETRERTYTDVVLGGIRGPPAVTAGTVFVATMAGDVYALAAD